MTRAVGACEPKNCRLDLKEIKYLSYKYQILPGWKVWKSGWKYGINWLFPRKTPRIIHCSSLSDGNHFLKAKRSHLRAKIPFFLPFLEEFCSICGIKGRKRAPPLDFHSLGWKVKDMEKTPCGRYCPQKTGEIVVQPHVCTYCPNLDV